MMSRIVGEADLPEIDRCYLEFGKRFEQLFIRQGNDENRCIEDSLDLGWRALGCLPRAELTRLSEADIQAHAELLDESMGGD